MAENHDVFTGHVSDVDESIRKNNYKLTADKIKQILTKVRNIPSRSYRRWVWELMQNAKDVENQFGRVSIQIVFKQDSLEFKHNGDPFLINHITALIQQVSSKASDSSDEEITGKFGTGFIITHLLSDLIRVKGVVQRPGNVFRDFEINLDRAGRTSEELLPKIEAATEHIRKIDRDGLFPVRPNYLENREETDYDTTFTYTLSSEEKKKAARMGLEDLKNTLPLTLANIRKIKKVEVIDKVEERETAYECFILKDDDCLREVLIKATWDAPFEQRSFLIYKTDQLALNAEVNDFEGLELIAHFGNQPSLYRDFPLIGSEKFHFPFVLNGYQFFPTEDRDSILLNSEESEEAQANRKVIEAAQQAAVEFTELLINRNAKKLYHLVYTRIPEVSFEDDAKAWYQKLQKAWRTKLLDLPLVETASGEKAQLKTCFIPYYGNKDETKLAFYDLLCPFLSRDKVPEKEFLLDWIKCVGPKEEMETWEGVELYFDLERMTSEIQAKEEVENLELDGFSQGPYQWLNSVFNFICREKETELLNEYAIIPNQYGLFRKLNELFEEDDQHPIPDHFLDILKRLEEDWRKDMISRRVDLSVLNHEKRGLNNASETINNFLKDGIRTKAGIYYKDFLQFPLAQDILVQILKAVEETTTGDGFQQKLFSRAKELLHFEENFKVVSGSASFNYGPAVKLMIRFLNQEIESCETIEGLSRKLKLDEDQTIVWLDGYLQLLQGKNEYKHFLEEANILPNRYLQLCSYEDIYAFGTEEHPLDDQLLNILQKLDPKQDWREFLVADGIGISLGQTKRLEELCNAIWEEMTRIKGEESYQQNREALLDFIDWGENYEEEAKRYFQSFDAFKDRVFFILMIEQSEHGKQVMQLFKNESQVKAFANLSASGVDMTKVTELVEISRELGSMTDILEHAQDLLQQKKDFEFLKELGETIEDVFQEALRDSEIGYQVEFEIERRGVGANDFIVRNKSNQKEFFIELKSHAHGKKDDIKMALSQANLCLNQPEQFALCVIERPVANGVADADFLQENIKWISNVSGVVQEPFELYSSFSRKRRELGHATLELELREEVKVALRMQYIEENFSTFERLIAHIKRQLQ